jgi:hypothetical protein
VTMPRGSVEEPDLMVTSMPALPVHVASSDAKPGRTIAAEFGQWRTFLIGPGTLTQVGPTRLCNRSLRRHRLHILVNSTGPVTSTPSPSTPAVPASGVAQQNTNAYPVSVAVSGGTVTAVFVNGIQVGSGDGTYIVPGYGSISITYSVAPTWVWSGIASTSSQPVTDGVIVGSLGIVGGLGNAGGAQAIPAGAGGYLQIGDNLRWEVQQELYAVYPSSNTAGVYVTVCDEMYESEGKQE